MLHIRKLVNHQWPNITACNSRVFALGRCGPARSLKAEPCDGDSIEVGWNAKWAIAMLQVLAK